MGGEHGAEVVVLGVRDTADHVAHFEIRGTGGFREVREENSDLGEGGEEAFTRALGAHVENAVEEVHGGM